MSFSHFVVYGMTGQGKSTLVKDIVKRIRAQQRPVILYSPTLEEGWAPGCRVCVNADQLEMALNDPKQRNGLVIIDEGYFLRNEFRPRKHPSIATLGNMGRHKGFTVWALTQFPTAIDHALRWNCRTCFCFRLANRDHADMVAKDFNNQVINGAPVADVIMNLPPLVCVKLTPETAEIVDIRHLIPRAGKGVQKGAKPRKRGGHTA